MNKFIVAPIIGLAFFGFFFLCSAFNGCSSKGEKWGLVQKVSERTTLCGIINVVEIAYEGGRATEGGSQNSQEFRIDTKYVEDFNRLIGTRVVFNYVSPSWYLCSPVPYITRIETQNQDKVIDSPRDSIQFGDH